MSDDPVHTADVLRDVAHERIRQDAKWGQQAHPPEWWLAILVEEVGEVAQEILGLKFGDVSGAKGDLRLELLQVAAVAVGAIEVLDYGSSGLDRVEGAQRP